MENTARLDNYLALLGIRQRAHRRNAFIIGGLLLMAILATSALLLLTGWDARSIWILGIFDLFISMNFVMTWVRYQITNENIELVKNLRVGE